MSDAEVPQDPTVSPIVELTDEQRRDPFAIAAMLAVAEAERMLDQRQR